MNISLKMEEKEQEVLDLEEEEIETEATENETETEAEESEDSEEEVDIEALRKENETLKAQKEHWRKKAEKSTASKEGDDAPKTGGLSEKDVVYLAKTDIHEEDIDEVLEMAKLKFGGDVRKAHQFMKPILAEKAEKRKTSETSHTGSARRSSQKLSDEALLEKASTGNIPESDEEIQRLIRAKSARKN